MSSSEMPKISLETFVLSIGTATMVALGEMDNPMTKKKDENLDAAKQNIDILEMLVEKTKGNLTETENKILTGVLFETRMKFVAKKK